jgi:hypothetical protein
MAKQKKFPGRRAKAGRFVIGSDGFAKINAVEGIKSTEAMKKRASEKRSKGLTAEEYRRSIISSYLKG